MSSKFWITVFALAVCTVAGWTVDARSAQYLGPRDVVASNDGATLFVTAEDANQVLIVNVAEGKVSGTINCPARPTGVALSPDSATLYITCAAPAGSVLVVNAASGEVTGTIPLGHGAAGPSVSPDGKRLYVCNQYDTQVAMIDLEAKKVTLVRTIREPNRSTVSPDGATLLVTNLLPIDRADAYDVAAAVSLIDVASGDVTNVRLPNGSSSLRGICVSPDGKYAYAVHILSRYQMPTTQLERGWMNTNAMSIIDVVEKKLINTVLLDSIDLGAANPWGVAVTDDGKSICVTHAGTHELSVIDADAMFEKLAKLPPNEEAARENPNLYADRGSYSSATQEDVPNDLAFLVGIRRRIRLPSADPWAPMEVNAKLNSPRGLAIVGSKVYIAACYSDALAVVNLESTARRDVSIIQLGPLPELTVVRRGEMLFHDASICFQHWQSCSSCHPDSRVDALNWDLMNDGMGNPKNVRTMLYVHRTPPAMSSGVRPSAEQAVRSGITRIMFAVRPEEDAVAIDEYLKSLTPMPSPYLVDGQFSEAAVRGQALFNSERVGCVTCHPGPLHTDLEMHDVGSRGQYDRRDDFDTPALVECWRTAPYMHDGRYTTMKELLTEGKHGAGEGESEGALSGQEMDDLVEYVLSL